MTDIYDTEHARRVKEAAEALRVAIEEAAGSGLHIELDTHSTVMQSLGNQKSVPVGWRVDVTIARPL